MTETTFAAGKAWGHGLATIASDGTVLDTWYPNPQLGEAPKTDALWVVPKELDALVGADTRRRVTTQVVRTEIDLELAVTSTADAYLRLHLLSHLLGKPNAINLDGLIAALPCFHQRRPCFHRRTRRCPPSPATSRNHDSRH